MGEVRFFALNRSQVNGEWRGDQIFVLSSPSGAQRDSFGATMEYLGPLQRDGVQASQSEPATGFVSLAVGAPDWRDASLSGNDRRFGAVLLVHIGVTHATTTGEVTMRLADHTLVSPARMPLLLGNHWPAEFERSCFGASIELVGFGEDHTFDILVGAPGFNRSTGTVVQIRLDLLGRLGPALNASSVAVMTFS